MGLVASSVVQLFNCPQDRNFRGRTSKLGPEISSEKMEAPPAPDARDWSALNVDALSLIFTKLGAIEVLMGAGLVCHSWLDTAKLPDMWRSVDMSNHNVVETMPDSVLHCMAKVAVDRSCGQLEAFAGKRFVNANLLKYIGDRAPSLKRLRLISCKINNVGFMDAIKKFPLLEDLELSLCPYVFGKDSFETIGMSCTHLTCFKWCMDGVHRFKGNYNYMNMEAMGITTMTKLCSLQIFGSRLNNCGLAAILDNCPNLESLDIRYCFNVKEDGALHEKCAGIRSLRLPRDSINDYEFKDNLPTW
ncbi:hypothetical protein EJB05_09633, partial [Eragrostis curvula]